MFLFWWWFVGEKTQLCHHHLLWFRSHSRRPSANGIQPSRNWSGRKKTCKTDQYQILSVVLKVKPLKQRYTHTKVRLSLWKCRSPGYSIRFQSWSHLFQMQSRLKVTKGDAVKNTWVQVNAEE
jgi:hypothetical protein